ncbi:2-methylcitrate synthase, partial [Paraburkholderia dipogonis]
MSEADNSMPNAGAFKPKKSVALSGVTAGNTALCTVGKTG